MRTLFPNLLRCSWVFAFSLASACQSSTGEVGAEGDTLLTESGEVGLTDTAKASPPQTTSAAASSDHSAHFALGPLADKDVRQAIYKTLEAYLNSSKSLGNNAEVSTELGDIEHFKFSIIKLTQGVDDVSGRTDAAADGMDVEVNGWYRREVEAQGEEPQLHCASFDVQLAMRKDKAEWVSDLNGAPTLTREDSEDCY